MRSTCWITKATNTHSQYVIVIAFPLQKWLRERALMFRYMYSSVCLVTFCFTLGIVLPTPFRSYHLPFSTRFILLPNIVISVSKFTSANLSFEDLRDELSFTISNLRDELSFTISSSTRPYL